MSADGKTLTFNGSVFAGTGMTGRASSGSVNYFAGNPIIWGVNSVGTEGDFIMMEIKYIGVLNKQQQDQFLHDLAKLKPTTSLTTFRSQAFDENLFLKQIEKAETHPIKQFFNELFKSHLKDNDTIKVTIEGLQN
ncbi:MAG: hypothetical protein EZS28_040419, partial [Streblomastix strix]